MQSMNEALWVKLIEGRRWPRRAAITIRESISASWKWADNSGFIFWPDSREESPARRLHPRSAETDLASLSDA